MVCFECGELLNMIDEQHLECRECGWTGTVKQWRKNTELAALNK